MARLFRNRRRNRKSLLGITKVRRGAKKALGITAIKKPFRTLGNILRFKLPRVRKGRASLGPLKFLPFLGRKSKHKSFRILKGWEKKTRTADLFLSFWSKTSSIHLMLLHFSVYPRRFSLAISSIKFGMTYVSSLCKNNTGSRMKPTIWDLPIFFALSCGVLLPD